MKSFWIEGWGNRNIDDHKCAKMPIFSYVISEDWTNVYACCSFKLIINNECLVYIHSLEFALIIYVTNIRQFHVSQFWHGTGPILPFVVLALWLQLFQWFRKIFKVVKGSLIFQYHLPQALVSYMGHPLVIFLKVTQVSLFTESFTLLF